MPKSPIQRRELFCDTLGDGSMRFLDWALVDTELGAMMESRPPMLTAFGINPVTNIDMIDFSFNKISYMDEGKFGTTFGTSGGQFPKDISTFDASPIKPATHR
jgi:hypothetical protein